VDDIPGSLHDLATLSRRYRRLGGRRDLRVRASSLQVLRDGSIVDHNHISTSCLAHSDPVHRYQAVYYGISCSVSCLYHLSLTVLQRKTPWRLSPHQKLRHRRRLRRVDNVVSVLDTALQRHKATDDAQRKFFQSQPPPAETPDPDTSSMPGNATAEEFRASAEGQRLLKAFKPAVVALETRRHGRGPRQGEFLPNGKLLRDAAAEAGTMKLLVRWKADMPTEQEMLPKDKYSIFDKKVRGYRKGVHKLPKWTRVSQRLNPPGF
jgi:hypothetical protein